MSGRRATNNRIRGPQSALTDFLASNNISAVQIRDEYERRRRAALQQAEQEAGANVEEPEEPEEEEREETEEQSKKRKRREEAAIAKIKKGKDFARRKARLRGEPGEDDDDALAFDMYAKAKPLPGQLENCEICDKRFTVTAYSKTGPDGGLLCPKCSKELDAGTKKDAKLTKRAVPRDKRRKFQSSLLDGIVRMGSKSLQELCVEKVARHISDVDELGDLPESLLDRFSQILSRSRVLDGRTLDLFLRPDLDSIAFYDCANLGVDEYMRIFAVVPKVTSLNLRNAGQLKDEVMDYILERKVPLVHLQLDAANLISDAKWREFFEKSGKTLRSLKVSWLDNSFDDETVGHMVRGCPNLRRFKMKKCFKPGDASLEALAGLGHLEHLSLRFTAPTTGPALLSLVRSVGPNLVTLSLEGFENADDGVLSEIHASCRKLAKLRFTDNDYCTDAALTALFTDWANPPLSFLDLSKTRDLDYSNPGGPEQPVGLASNGFKALMAHSGSRLEHLDISSCRHIAYGALADVFDGKRQYPQLKRINLSFLTTIDGFVGTGLFRSCPALQQVTVFGCFAMDRVAVPAGVALIGVPNAHESIVQEG